MKKLACCLPWVVVAVACAEPVTPPVEVEPVVESQQAALAGVEGDFFRVEQDFRRCVSPLCGGYWLSKLNWSYMQCPDGEWAKRCYVADVDLSALGYSAGWEDKVRTDINEGRGIVRGGFDSYQSKQWDLYVLEVLEAYEPVVGREIKGPFFRLGDNGIRCVTTPCDSTDISVLNWPFSTRLVELDDEAVPAAGEMVQRINQAMADQELLATGRVYHASRGGVGLEASLFWVPYRKDREGGCKDDADCSDGFCGCKDNECQVRSCKPWSQAGEKCGGFVAPPFWHRCAPGLSCMSNPLLPDLPGICAQEATVAEIEADPKAYDGSLVGIRGDAHQGLVYCTLRACTPDAPCCNACGGEQRLFDSKGDLEGGLRLFDGEEYLSCGGNECSIDCDRAQGAYLVVGTVSMDEWGTPQIEYREMYPEFYPEL